MSTYSVPSEYISFTYGYSYEYTINITVKFIGESKCMNIG